MLFLTLDNSLLEITVRYCATARPHRTKMRVAERWRLLIISGQKRARDSQEKIDCKTVIFSQGAKRRKRVTRPSASLPSSTLRFHTRSRPFVQRPRAFVWQTNAKNTTVLQSKENIELVQIRWERMRVAERMRVSGQSLNSQQLSSSFGPGFTSTS